MLGFGMGYYYKVAAHQTLPEVLDATCPLLTLDEVRDHEKNKPLFGSRTTYMLREGDQIWIPDEDAKVEWFQLETGAVLKLEIEANARPFKLFLHYTNGKVLASQPFTLTADGNAYVGTTTPEGVLELEIPADATRGVLKVKNATQEVIIGALDPVHTAKGVQARLANLGYRPGPIDGVFGPHTIRAIKAFQTALKLEVDGLVGPKTRAALQQEYGC
jgi:Putative peptidoglycan binding domain